MYWVEKYLFAWFSKVKNTNAQTKQQGTGILNCTWATLGEDVENFKIAKYSISFAIK